MNKKSEIAQSEALDKTAKIVSGLVPGGVFVSRFIGWCRRVWVTMPRQGHYPC